jgi:cardiolipin synthase
MAPLPDLKPLRDAGGQVARFASPLRGRANLRNHRKLLVADGGAGGHLWCGGRNLAAEYFEGESGEAPWQDLTFDLSGPLVAQAGALFERDWAFASGRQAIASAGLALTADVALRGAQVVASGPDEPDDAVYVLLVTAAHRARQRIALATPYFVPEPALLMALCLAARRGVRVDLLLPARSNHRLSDMARNRALRSLAAAGGRIWLAAGMLHAKLAVFDETLALAGSANLDSRSLFLNYELMVAFHDSADVRRFAAWFDEACAPANPYVARQPGLARDLAEGMLLWLAFQL